MTKYEKIGIGLVFLVIVSVVILFFVFFGNEKLESYKFTGHINNISETSIFIRGDYGYIDDPDYAKLSRYTEQFDVEVIIGPNTKITRTKLFLPPFDTEGMFMIDELLQESEAVDFGIMKEDYQNTISTLGIEIITEKEILGRDKFQALEVNYRLPVFDTSGGGYPLPNVNN